MRSFPCYNGGQDCPRREIGCRAGCKAWADAQAQHALEKAAMRVPEVICYNSDRKRKLAQDAAERRQSQTMRSRS